MWYGYRIADFLLTIGLLHFKRVFEGDRFNVWFCFQPYQFVDIKHASLGFLVSRLIPFLAFFVLTTDRHRADVHNVFLARQSNDFKGFSFSG